MISLVLSFVIPSLIALSVYLCGKRLTVGWLVGLTVQVFNGVYAMLTEHWGWLIGPVIVGPMFAKNWIQWRREDKAKLLNTSPSTLEKLPE